MFRLEKLEIHGFKSFADKTTLVFGEGITGIVGPNGCGKSNVSEAISWVLGEQSAKSLRGGKMEDVIFNGTRDRKPTGMAQVILTMVATQDITSRGDAKDDEEEYLEALDNAERAAATAKSLVEENTPKDESRVESLESGVAGRESEVGSQESGSGTAAPDSAGAAANEAVDANAAPPADTAAAPLADSEASVTLDQASAPMRATGGQEVSESDSQTVAEDGASTEPQTPEATDASVEAQTVEKKKVAKPRKKKAVAVMAGERITIGRRLYRTGESDYLMNSRPCLLRDIQDLFAGTGLGGAHYAIIEQGRIGQILSSKPLDRRALIEEAAGITKFKSRKRTTELRLESARQNLLRLNDIVTEVERQVNSLKRQAQKARRYKRLRDEMRALQKAVFTADYYRLNETAARLTTELEEALRSQGELDAALGELEGEYRVVSAESRAAEDALVELRERAAAVDLEADRARNRRDFEARQAQELTSRIEELRRDQQDLEVRLELIEADTEQRVERLQALEAEVSSAQVELHAQEVGYQRELSRLRESESGIEQLRQRLLAEIGATERLKNLRANLEDSLRRTELRQNSLRSELERAATRRDEASAECARVADEVEGGRARLAELSRVIGERVEVIDALRRNSRDYTQELDGVRSERTSAAHRLSSLEDLDAHHAYYSDTVQQVLSPEQAANINALGTLADFVEVEAQYEKLVESLFARELQCMMVPTIDDALTGVEFIKSEGLGRGAFLVVGLHGGEDESSEGGDPDIWASDSDNGSHENPSDHGNRDANDIGQTGGVTDSERRNGDAESPEDHEALEAEAYDFIREESNGYDLAGGEEREQARHQTPDTRHQTPSIGFELDALSAVQLLGLRPAIKAVVERAFPDKCAALVVPDMEAALQLSIENPTRVYVTTDGEQVVNGRLIMTGGQEVQKGTSLLALKREIKQLRIQTEILREEEERVAADLAETRGRLEEIEGEATRLDQELRQNERSAAAKGSQLEALARDLERAEQHVRVVQGEIEQAAVEREEVAGRIETLALEVQAAEESREAAQVAVASAQAALTELRAGVEQLAESLASARADAAARSERLQAARSEMRRVESEANELRSRINRNRVESYESQTRVEQLAASQAEGESATRHFDEQRDALSEEINAASVALATARARADELEQTLSETRRQASSVRDVRSHLEVEQARVESEAEHLSRTCMAELAMPLEEVVRSQESEVRGQESGFRIQGAADDSAQAVGVTEGLELQAAGGGAASAVTVSEPEEGTAAGEATPTPDLRPLPPDLEAARARLDELRVKLDDIGPVNMMALEELEEAEGRFTFLSEQRRDILDSIKMTEEALSEIKRRSRERFRHAFAHINDNFQRMFVELFGGGRGEMILLDEDDVLESGIDIIAQPPGKRLQSVLLLSGGEKAMSAIALVLAIFQYKPSPFCILDEVDAPLDEVNVGRFAGKVAEMSSDTQFLVITHNKRTMEAARALYGVTMEEPGISKLVSVKFE